MKNFNLELYFITNRDLMTTNTLVEAVEQAIEGGATMVQLREKNLSTRDFLEEAIEIKKITDKHNIALIINDRIDIALALNADGVHLGQSDMPIDIARKLLGPNKIIGISANTSLLAKEAQEKGADYIGIGAIFSTSTKSDAENVSIETLKDIIRGVKIPTVAIGGINENNIRKLKGLGLDGYAIISAIIAKDNVKMAAKKLKEIINE